MELLRRRMRAAPQSQPYPALYPRCADGPEKASPILLRNWCSVTKNSITVASQLDFTGAMNAAVLALTYTYPRNGRLCGTGDSDYCVRNRHARTGSHLGAAQATRICTVSEAAGPQYRGIETEAVGIAMAFLTAINY